MKVRIVNYKLQMDDGTWFRCHTFEYFDITWKKFPKYKIEIDNKGEYKSFVINKYDKYIEADINPPDFIIKYKEILNNNK